MADYSDFPSDGITKDTPKHIMFGAGTIHKDLYFDRTTKK